MKIFKNISFAIIAVILFFAIAEGMSRIFIFPGSYDFIERRAIEQNLPQHKGKDEFRIQLYGESTMHGCALYPYSTIDKWIRLYIKDLLPEKIAKRVTVTNFARLGSSSAFTTSAFIETTPYRPDLAVFYMAHNDFAQVVNRRPRPAHKPLKETIEDFTESLPKHSSFCNVINGLIIRAKIAINMRLDKRSGEADSWYADEDDAPRIAASDLLYPGSPQFNTILKNFEDNVEKVISAAKARSIPVVFLEGVSRWRGFGLGMPMHDPSLKSAALEEWNKNFTGAEAIFSEGRYPDAIKLYNKCIELDPFYAMTYYRIAECHEGLREFGEANEFYVLANDRDCFPIRGPSAVNRFYESLRASHMQGVYIIKTQSLFEKQSPNGIVDGTLISDQVHPTIKGQALIALMIVKIIYDNDLLASKGQWRWDRLRTVEEMQKDLGLDKEAEFRINLASANYVKRYYPKALEFLENALALEPGSIFAKSWLAWTYWKAGDKNKALGLYRQLDKDVPAAAAKFFERHPEIKKEMQPAATLMPQL